jgi:hypothetical protein
MEKKTAADAVVLISRKNGAVIDTIQEYFSAITNERKNDSNGKATENAKQTSTKVE